MAQPVTRYWYAGVLLARGDPGARASARALLSEPLAMFDSLGMPVYARRTSEKLGSLSL